MSAAGMGAEGGRGLGLEPVAGLGQECEVCALGSLHPLLHSPSASRAVPSLPVSPGFLARARWSFPAPPRCSGESRAQSQFVFCRLGA